MRFGAAPLVIVLAAAAPAAGRAQFESVGTIDFPTSDSGEAQQHFLRGVAILHSFGWKQAIAEFHAAEAIDPNFAMAYWGESLAYNHPLFSQMDPTQPRAALARLAATPEERLAKAPTDREKGFLSAVEVLWGAGDHAQRRIGYMQAMQHLYSVYPDDVEVALFYALSMLSAAQEDTGAPARPAMAMSMPMPAASGTQGATPMPMPHDQAPHEAMAHDMPMPPAGAMPAEPLSVDGQRERLMIRAGAITLGIFAKHPNHPGAAHYTIHAFDDPIHAPLALEAAYRYAEIAPAVSHAIHMPTHIFIQHGLWDLVADQNQRAYDAARDLWEPGDDMGDAIHALDWGQYGALQAGDYPAARRWIDRIASMANEGSFLGKSGTGPAGSPRAVSSLDLLRARYTVETQEWEIRPVSAESSPDAILASALSAYHLHDQDALRQADAAMAGAKGGVALIVKSEVDALMHAGMGHAEMVMASMDEAQREVDALPPPNGAASPVKPVHELYGELLMDLGRPDLATAKFKRSLELMPNRARSLLGFGRAYVALGNPMGGADAYEKLAEMWAGHETLPEIPEVRMFWRMYLGTNHSHTMAMPM
jgi:tetratricopeptide (TPR) repeat protein